MPLSLRYAARSDVGLVRTGNEDSGYAGARLLAVADGMGGHAAGEVASSVALAALAPLDDDDSGGDLLDALAAAVNAAEATLGRAVDAQPELEGMGTTLTAMLWAGNRIGLAHVGDSRAYLLRGGELMQLTRDHTYVQSLVDSGSISADEAASHPRRSLLTRALDGHTQAEPDLSIREVRAGDRFLLCSDGLSAVVSESTILEALGEPEPVVAVDRLVELALRGGGPDNITAIVSDVVETRDGRSNPAVEAVVVGAAAEAAQSGGPSLGTPAGRAAAALRPETDAAAPDNSAADRARRRRWTRRTIAGVLALALVVVAAVGFVAFTRTQYYVGVQDGQVTIFQGIPQDVLGLSFSSVYETQQIDVADLPAIDQANVSENIVVDSLGDARTAVETLRASAAANVPVTTFPAPATTAVPVPSGSPQPSVRDTDVIQP